MAVYSIEYDEPNVLSYKHTKISYGDNEKKIFDSGDFIKDWFDLIKFIVTELFEREIHFVGSSSVDHFFMDGADELYDIAYLNSNNTSPELVYEVDDMDIMIQLYVPKGTQPTWDELKNRCKL